MIHNFIAEKPTIIAALKLDETSLAVAKLAHQLAEKLQKKLCLVHICEPWMDLSSISLSFRKKSRLSDITQAFIKEAKPHAEEGLAAIKTELGDPSVKTFAIAGDLNKDLEAIIQGHQTALVVTGRRQSDHFTRPFGHIFSTTLSLVEEAQTPILVTQYGQRSSEYDLQDGLYSSVLLFDDLKTESEAIIPVALTFAEYLCKEHLTHCHITGLNPKKMALGMKQVLGSFDLPIPAEEATENLYTAALQHIEERMRERTLGHIEYLEAAGIKYDISILSKDSDDTSSLPILEEKEHHNTLYHAASKQITVNDADLVIFGRPQPSSSLKFIPKSFGDLPPQTILSFKPDLLILPASLQ